MTHQTALDWLMDQLDDKDVIHPLILWKAKAMEKQQIIDACNLQRNDYRGMPTYNKSGEQYYNETYEK